MTVEQGRPRSKADSRIFIFYFALTFFFTKTLIFFFCVVFVLRLAVLLAAF